MQYCSGCSKIIFMAFFFAAFTQPAFGSFNVLSEGKEVALTTIQGDETSTVFANSDGILTMLGEKDGSTILAAINGSSIFELAASEKIGNEFISSAEEYISGNKIPLIIRLNAGDENEGSGLNTASARSFDAAKNEVLSILNKGTSPLGIASAGSGNAESDDEVRDLRIIDSIALSVDVDDVDRLLESHAVKNVEIDRKVTVLLNDSVPLINATLAWQRLVNGTNVTGANKTIAIIDTGVDYTHPDLGGCLGSSCKVVGGRDFINNDNDPMDDHGHGTHVAATAAGNNTLNGVAPNARIYAYKVLSQFGFGTTSGVISGVERATDPNNDGNYSDHVDILSMSLGGFGDETSALSAAVNTAVNRGVVAVVAAGNSGTSTNAIGTPGSAEKAITIAATTKQDAVAYFSSRGLTAKNNLKPDVAAPGVSICAAQWDSAWSSYRCYDTKHIAVSGTSMATPHVAGLAALILQEHPDWTPEMVKSAIMGTSKDLGNVAWAQGTGRIQALKAVEAKVVTFPQSISFGILNNTAPSRNITIKNAANATISINISATNVSDGTNSYNISSVNASSLTIASGTNASISFSFNATNLSGTFYGYVNITDGNQSYRVPYAFIKQSDITIIAVNGSAALRPSFIVLHNGDVSVSRSEYLYYQYKNNATFNVPVGNYTVYAVGDWNDRELVYMLSANVTAVSGTTTSVTLDLQNATKFTVLAHGIDNEVLDMYKWAYGFQYKNGTKSYSVLSMFFGFGFTGNRSVYISNTTNFNTNFSLYYIGYPNRPTPSFESTYTWRDETFATTDRLYFLGWVIPNVTNATQTTLNFTQPELAVYNYTYNYPAGDPYDAAQFNSFINIYFWISPATVIDISPWIDGSAPLKRNIYAKGNGFGFWHYMYINYLRNSTLGGDWRSEFGAAVGQKEEDYRWQDAWPYGIRPNASVHRDIRMGTNYIPTFFNVSSALLWLQIEDPVLKAFNNETYMKKSSSVTVYSSDGTYQTVSLPTPRLIVKRNGTQITNTTLGWRMSISSLSNGYQYEANLTIPTGYNISNIAILANFSMPSASNLPRLTDINTTPRFQLNVPWNFTFNITDDNIASVAAEYSTNGTWVSINLTNTSTNYNSSITLSSGTQLELRILASDATGNNINYTFTPIALIGRNVSLGFNASRTTAERGNNILLNGRITDNTTGKNLTRARLEYYLNNALLYFDRAGYSPYSWLTYAAGYFNFNWTVPGDYSSSTATLDAVYNGTGVYLPRNETITINVILPAQQAPSYSNFTRTGQDANDNITFNATWTSNTNVTVRFESNHSGTMANYTPTANGTRYNYTIFGSLNASQNISYRFIANNSAGTNSTDRLSFLVQEIAANISAGSVNASVSVDANNTLWCDYAEAGNGDVTGATVKADISGSNNTMSYNSSAGRYEYIVSFNTTGTKSWNCYANKTNYQSKNTASSFSVQESDAPVFSNITRTADPIYNDMNISLNATWADTSNIGTVVFLSNHTGSWTNTTWYANASSPYTANYTLPSANLTNGASIAWRYIASDAQGNANDNMPLQSFSVENRNASIAINASDDNKGWGEAWNFTLNASDADNDTLNVSAWAQQPNGTLIFVSSRNVSGTRNAQLVNFTLTLNRTYVGTALFAFNASDGRISNSTNITRTVEKNDVNVSIVSGTDVVVLRESDATVNLSVRIYDLDKGENASGTIAKIYWTNDGSEPYDSDEICNVSNGACSALANPGTAYTTGGQQFSGGTLNNDSFYKEANSTNSSFIVNGTIFTAVNGPVGVMNTTSLIVFNTTATDDTSNTVAADDVFLEYKNVREADWKICTPVSDDGDGVYTCSLNATNLSLGVYGIRFTARKVNHTSVNTTVAQQFLLVSIKRFTTRLNLTKDARMNVNATELNVSLDILLNNSLNNTDLNVTFNSSNPVATNLSVRELGKYIQLNATSEFTGNISYIILTINYTDEEVNNSGIVEDSLRIYRFNGTNWTAYDPPLGGVNTTANYVWANITNFSDFGIGGKKENGVTCSSSGECSSGNCATDFDGNGIWCAPANSCAHDYNYTYASGYSTCSDSSTLQTCSSGSWAPTSCSGGCSAGVCSVASSGSSGSSGGGGGGGVVIISAAPEQEKATAASVGANTAAVLKFAKMELAVSQITITPNIFMHSVQATVKAADAPVVVPDNTVYKYLNITSPMESGQIASASMRFAVPKAWIETNSIDASSIRMNRLAGGNWQKLLTTLAGNISGSYVYEAETPGFSIFAITGEKAKKPVCGNSIIEEGEECDESNVPGRGCPDFGFDYGPLKCSACKFDTSGCYSTACGNGICELGERDSCLQDCGAGEGQMPAKEALINETTIAVAAGLVVILVIALYAYSMKKKKGVKKSYAIFPKKPEKKKKTRKRKQHF